MPHENTPSEPVGPRRRGPRGDVSRARIVAAASAVLDASGPAAVSTRAVAAAAGVTPTTIYTYVDDMGDLLNAVGDDFLGTIDLTGLDDPDPRAAVRAVLVDVWLKVRRRPGMGRLLASRRIVGANSLTLNEALLRRLDAAGLAPRRARDGVYALTAYLYGHLVCSVPDGADGTVAAALARLDPGDYPLTASSGVTDAAAPAQEAVDLTGLDILLDGLLPSP